MPGPDQPVKLQYLLLDPSQLSPECQETRAGHLRNPPVAWIGYDIEQFLDTAAPNRCNDPELGKMAPDRVDHRGLLTDEQMARSVQQQATLLLRSFGGHEPHVGPGDCLANRLCVGCVILLPLDIGLHVGWRHQPHGVTKCLEFARPMMRRGAGFDADQTRRKLFKERQDRAPLQLATYDHLATSINAMNLKDRLCDIQTDCHYRLHGLLL